MPAFCLSTFFYLILGRIAKTEVACTCHDFLRYMLCHPTCDSTSHYRFHALLQSSYLLKHCFKNSPRQWKPLVITPYPSWGCLRGGFKVHINTSYQGTRRFGSSSNVPNRLYPMIGMNRTGMFEICTILKESFIQISGGNDAPLRS